MSFIIHEQKQNSYGVIQSILINKNPSDCSFKKIAMYSMAPLSDSLGDSVELSQIYGEEEIQYVANDLIGSDCMTVEYLFGENEDINSAFEQFTAELFSSRHILDIIDDTGNNPFVILTEKEDKSVILSNIDAYDTDLSLNKYEQENRLLFVAGQAYDDTDIIYTLTRAFCCLPDFKGFKIPELKEVQDDINEELSDSDLTLTETLESLDMNFGNNPLTVFRKPEFYQMMKIILNNFFVKNEFNIVSEYSEQAKGLLKLINKVETYKQLPDLNKVKLVYIYDTSNKEYSLTLSGNDVIVEYGGIGKKIKQDIKNFNDHQKAAKFFNDKFLSKFKEGYEIESYN